VAEEDTVILLAESSLVLADGLSFGDFQAGAGDGAIIIGGES
jgi:hypothetical protein